MPAWTLVSGQLLPPPILGLGLGLQLGLVLFLGLGSTRQLPRRKIDPPQLGLGVGLGLVYGLGAFFHGGNYPRTLDP